MKLKYTVRSAYGEERMYLAGRDIAAAVQTLTGCKSVTPTHKKALEQLGFTFERLNLTMEDER